MARRKKGTVPTSAGPPPGAPPDYPGPPSPLPPALNLKSEHIGAPLAALGEYLGKYQRVLFEFAGMLLGEVAQANDPDYTEQATHFLQDERLWREISRRARERLSPDLHERAEGYVASDELRRSLFHDVLSLIAASALELSRFNLDERFSGLAERLGMPLGEALAPEERQAALQRMDEGVGRATTLLIDTYIEHVIQVVTAGEAQPTPVSVAPFNQDAITVFSGQIANAAIQAMWANANGQQNSWQRSENGPPYFRADNGVHIYVQEGSDYSPQALEAAWRRVLSLDDNKVSTFLICLGKWFADTGGESTAITKTRISVADILGFRGLKKHGKGGYRREQKEEARRDILALHSIWVRSRETIYKARGKSEQIDVESPLLDVAVELQPDLFGVNEPYAFRIAPGEWARHYLGQHSRYTAQLLRPVMQYDPYKRRLPMRLGIYLASQWRIRATTGNYEQPWRVRKLLEGAFIPLPTAHYQRLRDQFEEALDLLQQDKVIAGWEYASADDELPLRKWFERWLEWRVRIMPPDITVDRYESIAPRRRQAIGRSKRASRAARQQRGDTTTPP